jgi:glycosyltransferase involved in cell wall biosynthesis
MILTVGLPVRNGAQYLPRAIETLLSQHFGDFELLISDNASTDGTADVCSEYAKLDARIRYVRQATNIGGAQNFTYLLRDARTPLFAWAAHDDEWAPEFLKTCVGLLELNPLAAIAYSAYQPVDLFGEPFGPPIRPVGWEGGRAVDRWSLAIREWGVHAAIYGVMRTSLAQETRGLLDFVSADLVFMAELLMLGSLVTSPEPLHRKRMYGDRHYVPAWHFPRYHVTREMVRGAARFGEGVAVLPSAIRYYMSSAGIVFDVKTGVKGMLRAES